MNDKINSHSEVSRFQNVKDTKPRTVQLHQLIELFKKDKKHKDRIELIASLESKEERNKLKAKLPCIIVGALVKGGAAVANIFKNNLLVFGDIDLTTCEEADKALKLLTEHFGKYCHYIAKSPSGRGVHMIVQTGNADKYEESWLALKDDIGKYGYQLDEAAKSRIQKMYLGFVHSAYINEAPEPYLKLAEVLQVVEYDIEPNKVDTALVHKVEAYIDQIEFTQIDITAGYEPWMKIGFALASLGEAGREYYSRVSQFNPEFNQDKCSKMFDSCLKASPKKKIKIGTFFHFCHEAGIKTVKAKKSKDNKKGELDAEDHILANHKLRFNVVLNRIEIRDEKENTYIPLSDRKANTIYRDLRNNDIKLSPQILQLLLNSDLIPDFHPFEDYFYNLPQYIDNQDHIQDLLSTVKTTNDSLWLKYGKKWIIAMVASALVDKIVNHEVVIFVGGQGIGKTKWVDSIVPEQLKGYVYNGTINPDNKDTLIHLSECLIINLDELANLNKSEVGSLKSLITLPSVRLRRAYGRYQDYLPHRASFIGSSNDDMCLRDSTGNRRWLCFDVERIDYEHKINLDMVYAQALCLFQSGYQYWSDSKDIAEIEKNNEKFVFKTMEEETLLYYFRPCPKEKADFLWSTTRIAEYLNENYKSFSVNNSVINNLGKALKSNNFVRTKKDGCYVYAIKQVPFDEIEEDDKIIRMSGKKVIRPLDTGNPDSDDASGGPKFGTLDVADFE